MKIDLNDAVTLQLTPSGIDVLWAHWNFDGNASENLDIVHPSWRDGKVTMELWKMAHIFGPSMFNGQANMPFVSTTIELRQDGVVLRTMGELR